MYIYICRNFVTYALPEFGDSCAVAHEHIITPLHVVLWIKAQNSSYHLAKFKVIVIK